MTIKRKSVIIIIVVLFICFLFAFSCFAVDTSSDSSPDMFSGVKSVEWLNTIFKPVIDILDGLLITTELPVWIEALLLPLPTLITAFAALFFTAFVAKILIKLL